jgi:hypothetical protein
MAGVRGRAVITNLGWHPASWRARDYKPLKLPQIGSEPDFVKASTRRCGSRWCRTAARRCNVSGFPGAA